MSDYEVKYGVAIPPRKRAGRAIYKYPFSSMRIGGMIEVPAVEGDDDNLTRTKQRVTQAARQYAKRHQPEARYSVRDLTNATGTRVVGLWRVA